MDFTVAIPTFNGAARLPLLLDRLQEQQDLQKYSCEVIIVDNNSTDQTKNVVESYQHRFCCTLKYCHEPKQGAAHARHLAIRESKSDLVGFLDDDNIPEPNWVKEAILFGGSHPHVGAFGSRIQGDFEIDPPQNFDKISFFLAITELGDKPLIYSPQKKMLPPTAGLVVRKNVWIQYVSVNQFLSGPTTDINLNSEDLEILLDMQKAGYEIWYNPLMKITHKIPAARLTRKGLLKTIRGTGLARHYIRMKRYSPWLRPVIFIVAWTKDLWNLVVFYIKHQKLLATDVVKACQLEFLRSTVISPFYLSYLSVGNLTKGLKKLP